jgi:hypothetical protein
MYRTDMTTVWYTRHHIHPQRHYLQLDSNSIILRVQENLILGIISPDIRL